LTPENDRPPPTDDSAATPATSVLAEAPATPTGNEAAGKSPAPPEAPPLAMPRLDALRGSRVGMRGPDRPAISTARPGAIATAEAAAERGEAGNARIAGGWRGVGGRLRDDMLSLGQRLYVLVPSLAALVGLLALGGAVIVDQSGRERDAQLRDEIAELREALQLSSQIIVRNGPAAAAEAARAALAAEQASSDERLNALETQLSSLGETLAALPAGGVSAAAGPAIALEGPTEDCIPLQTRFMVTAGDNYAICNTPVVVDVVDVTGNSVILEGVEPIYAGGFTRLGIANCTAMVFSAGVEGFAEMRIAC
jgi:hypothetical protein